MRSVAVVSLGSIGGLHLLWALGSPWPAADRAALADAIGGFAEVPRPAACIAVAALLALSASATAGFPRSCPPIVRCVRAATWIVLALRGIVGITGNMPQARRSATFAALDRRVYSPICLAIAAGAFVGTIE
jgi:hypothetical protein